MLKENLDNIAKMNNEVYVLGRLATGRSEYPNMIVHKGSVISEMNNSKNIAFFVEALSDQPEYSRDILNAKVLHKEIRELYIGIDSHQFYTSVKPFTKETKYNYLSTIQKEDIIYEYLEGKLLIFKINLQKNTSGILDYNKNLILQDILDIDDDGESYYRTIPEVQNNVNIFEDELFSQKIIYLKGYTHDLLVPEAIICGEYIYTGFDLKDWEKVDGTIDGWRFTDKSKSIKKSQLNIKKSDYDTKVIRKLDSIVFVQENYFYDELCDNVKSIPIENSIDIKEKIEQLSIIKADEMNDTTKNSSRKVNQMSDISEVNFLNKLKNYTMSKNLCYDIKDIVNLHVSIKTNHITIVAGMSGTGKTQISLAYADVLGLSEKDKTLLFLPITPSYTEPEDITGYLNTTTGLFVSSETGLVDLLMHAQEHQDKLHFIVFDEMNLSQVEHWFAPFISLLELDRKDRNLKLYSENSVCHNRIQYSPTINIGDNIRFIGTVNLDETTKDFSDRLLDRANLVSLKKGSLKDFKREKKEFNKVRLETGEFKFSDYLSWIDKNVTVDELLDNEIDLLDELHTLISSNDSQKGVSFRIAEKIASYLQNLPVDENGEYILGRGEAFDLEIKQRVLTKLKGTERQFGNLIGKIDLQTNEIVESPLDELFNSYEGKSIGNFKLTKDEIIRKARELSIYGYAN